MSLLSSEVAWIIHEVGELIFVLLTKKILLSTQDAFKK